MPKTDQSAMALRRANTARAGIAELRAAIRAGGRRGGPIRAATVILAAESPIRLTSLLTTIPGVGEDTAAAILRRSQANGTARVNGWQITDRQRQRLAGELMARAGQPAG